MEIQFVLCKVGSEFLNIPIILRLQLLTCSALWCDEGDERRFGKGVEGSSLACRPTKLCVGSFRIGETFVDIVGLLARC
jgi:hypothetical protein